jgi:hypothetical protein
MYRLGRKACIRSQHQRRANVRIRASVLAISVLAAAISATSPATEDEFRQKEPEILRKCQWVANNPLASSWGDSLRAVLKWGNDVPYLAIGTKADYLGDLVGKTEDQVVGRVCSVWLVGCIQGALECTDKADCGWRIAKSAIESMVVYYRHLKATAPELSIDLVDKYAKMVDDKTLDGFVKKKER